MADEVPGISFGCPFARRASRVILRDGEVELLREYFGERSSTVADV